MIYFDRRLIAQFDWILLGVTFLIPVLALIVLYSASYDPYSTPQAYSFLGFAFETQSPAFFRQLIYYSGGFLILLLVLSLPTDLTFRLAYPFYCFCLLSLVTLFFVGQVSHGSRRWFSFGLFNLQPSELMKLGLILALAKYLSKNPPQKGGYRFLQLLLPFALFLVPMGLIMKQPDLGTALALGAVGFAMILFLGIRIRPLVVMALSVLGAGAPMWFFLKPYQKRRIMALFNPEADPLGSGYHIIQSKIAVGSGASFGKGFLQGTQTQLEFLPERSTDFIFSVLAEEWGFLGSLLVLGVYFIFVVRIMRIVGRSKALFPALVTFGVGVQIFFHTFINVGMVIGIVPVVGLPLPLFSYGGSSVLLTMISIGLVLGFSMRRLSFVTK